jgi:hypothetical protein
MGRLQNNLYSIKLVAHFKRTGVVMLQTNFILGQRSQEWNYPLYDEPLSMEELKKYISNHPGQPVVLSLGEHAIEFSNLRELASGLSRILQPFGVSAEALEQTLNALKSEHDVREYVYVLHDSGNDHDDQLVLLLLAWKIMIGSIDPNKVRIIGIPNPKGVDANPSAKEFLRNAGMGDAIPDRCWFRYEGATILNAQAKNPWSPQSQKLGAAAGLPDRMQQQSIRNHSTWILESMLDPKTQPKLHLGAAAGGIVQMFFQRNNLGEAVETAYVNAVKKYETVLPVYKHPKDVSLTDPKISIELAEKVYKEFKQQLKDRILSCPSDYLHPSLFDRASGLPKSLNHLRILYQGSPNGAGQNQKFATLFTTRGAMITVEEYDEAWRNRNKVPVVAVPDAELLESILKETFDLKIEYCSANPSVVVSDPMRAALGKEVLNDEVIENYAMDGRLAAAPSLLCNEKNLSCFFNSDHFFSDMSKSFSLNAHAYRILLCALADLSEMGPIDQQLSLGDKQPKQIMRDAFESIRETLKGQGLGSVLEKEIPSDCSDIGDRIDYLFDGLYGLGKNPEDWKIGPDWDPRSISEKSNFRKPWNTLQAKFGKEASHCPTIDDVKDLLKGLMSKGERSEPWTLAERFALKLLQLHADGLKAQKLCIDNKVTGTQEACYRTVNGVCSDFMKLKSGVISIAPFDLENARRLFNQGSPAGQELQFVPLTVLTLLGADFAKVVNILPLLPA